MKLRSLIASLIALSTSVSAFATDKVVIISPHRKSIQNEYVPAFKEWYKTKYKNDVEVEWLDQGGTNDDIKFLRSKYAANAKTSGIDIFWGGGTTGHNEVAKDKLSEKLTIPANIQKQIPKTLGGMPTMNPEGTFMSQAASSFGIFFNKTLLKIEKLPEPTTWENLGEVKYKDKLVLTDPRKSGSVSVMNHLILESLGWDKGFQLLTTMAGNARQFTASSSDPIKAIISGDAAATPAIDFYAIAKIGDIGADKLGFVLPEGKTIIEGDPVSILKGAPNRQIADRFVEFILSTEGQSILVLPKGAAGGPKIETLGRLAVNTETYKLTEGKRVNPTNPFNSKGFMTYDTEKQAKVRAVFDDMLGASLVDSHKELRDAWARVIAKGAKAEDVAALAKPPVNAKELEGLAAKWSDPVFRNETINKWVKYSQDKYAKIAK